MRNESTLEEGVEQTGGDCCRLIPIAHLSLDLEVPVGGWELFLAEQGIDVMVDDCGRPAIARSVFASMVRHQTSQRKLQSERAALRQMEQAEVERRTPVSVGVPAVEGLTAFETVMASGEWVSPSVEFGRPKPNFIADELAEGQRLQREAEKANRIRKGKE